jgi:capsular polysaccharide biosynthesis protein
MNNAMTQSGKEVEISLADMWVTVKRHKWIVLIAPVVCGIAAYILVSFVMAPKWQASAILQIGRVGGEKPVEPVANVIARMQHPSFAAGVTNRGDFKPGDLPTAKAIYRGSFKVNKIKDAELIEFSVQGYSPTMARNLASHTVSYLQKTHDEMMSASVTRINAQIQTTDEEIQKLKLAMDLLRKQLQGKHDWNSYNATLAATVLEDEAKELRGLTQRKLLLTEQLGPSSTFSTQIIGEVSVSENPVSPKKLSIVGMALLLGLFGGIFLAFARNAVGKGSV